MNIEIQNKCDLLVKNRELIESKVKLGNPLMTTVAALIFTEKNVTVDVDKFAECKKLLEKNTGTFSGFQAISKVAVISKLALADNPEDYLNKLKNVYEKLGKGMISNAAFIVQASISIVDAKRDAEVDALKEKFDDLYKRMKKEHPLLTDHRDISFIANLALTNKDVDTIIKEMEECYDYLKKDLKVKIGNNEIQGVSEILALTDGDMKEKCDKIASLYDTFTAHKTKYGKVNNEYASLGVLIDINKDKDELVDEIIETANYIKGHKGFGNLSISDKIRLMFAAMLTSSVYNADNANAVGSAMNSSVAVVIAEQLMVLIIVTSAAAASSH
ncbi:MAG: DUF4003 domain-containing protein [Lachnospiraceae bacterium]|nr:DUF4003 domain-containing protein [Lachnospiraceae bacterium]